MRTTLMRLAFAALTATTAGIYGTGCTVNTGDLNVDIKDPKVTFNTDVDVNNVKQGDAVPIHIDAQNVYLVDPDQDPPADHEEDAGHFQIYLDDTDGEALLITAEVDVKVTIPEATPTGKHKLICRVHKHDGTPTSAVFEIDITVTAKASTG